MIGKAVALFLSGILGVTFVYLVTFCVRPMITGTEIWQMRCLDCGHEWWQEIPIGALLAVTCPACGSNNTEKLFRILGV